MKFLTRNILNSGIAKRRNNEILKKNEKLNRIIISLFCYLYFSQFSLFHAKQKKTGWRKGEIGKL
jgi:hypothetical protein